jgi:hypothetical protein
VARTPVQSPDGVNDPDLSKDLILMLSKDLKAAAQTMGRQEIRYLVDTYYQVQDYRKASGNQQIALRRSDEPNALLSWVGQQFEGVEGTIKKALDYYTQLEPTGVGQWMRQVHGIGPVIAAGMMAHIDITKANTPSKIYRFAGLDPTSIWLKGEKRPWNARLKVLCYYAGESFVKTSSSDKSFYGPLYRKRKAHEWNLNLEGSYALQAEGILANRNYRDTTDAYQWYTGAFAVPPGCVYTGDSAFPFFYNGEKQVLLPKAEEIGRPGQRMLPPAHIQARAKRQVVKLFISHLHEVMYHLIMGEPQPEPYPIAILGHQDRIPCPNLPPIREGGMKLWIER